MKKWKKSAAALFAAAVLALCPAGSASAAAPFAQGEYTYQIGEGEFVQSPEAILVDASTGTVLAAKNESVRVNPASLTKLMTLLVVCEHVTEHVTDLTQRVTITQDIPDYVQRTNASAVGFSAGEQPAVLDLLFGIILPSGADACIAAGRLAAGSDAAFVDMMNEKAISLGLANTCFSNCTGITAANHYSCAADLAVILKACQENPIAWQVLCTQDYTTSPTVQHPEGIALHNSYLEAQSTAHPLPGTLVAAKSGYTSAAGLCGASFFVSREGKAYICVTLGGDSSSGRLYDQASLYVNFCR